MLVTLVMLATCFGLLCGIGILFGIVGLLLKFGGILFLSISCMVTTNPNSCIIFIF